MLTKSQYNSISCSVSQPKRLHYLNGGYYMRNVLFLTGALLAMNMPAHTAQIGTLENFEEVSKNFNRYNGVSDEAIPLIMGKVSQLLGSGINPKKIAFIFDVDGTLILFPEFNLGNV